MRARLRALRRHLCMPVARSAAGRRGQEVTTTVAAGHVLVANEPSACLVIRWGKNSRSRPVHDAYSAVTRTAERWDSEAERWDSEAERWDSEAEWWDSEAGRPATGTSGRRWDSEAERWDSEAEWWDSEAEQWDSEAEWWDSEAEQWDSEAERWDSEAGRPATGTSGRRWRGRGRPARRDQGKTRR